MSGDDTGLNQSPPWTDGYFCIPGTISKQFEEESVFDLLSSDMRHDLFTWDVWCCNLEHTISVKLVYSCVKSKHQANTQSNNNPGVTLKSLMNGGLVSSWPSYTRNTSWQVGLDFINVHSSAKLPSQAPCQTLDIYFYHIMPWIYPTASQIGIWEWLETLVYPTTLAIFHFIDIY